MASARDDRYQKEHHRPESSDQPIAKTLKPAPAATPTPSPSSGGGVSKMVQNVMDKASDVTTGGAKSLVEGALKHF